MDKIYSKKSVSKLKPKKETISFLLNYSKALCFMKVGNFQFETILN